MAAAIVSNPNEIWKPVVGYEEIYKVSSLGRIISFGTFLTKSSPILLKQMTDKYGYHYVNLSKDKIKRQRKVHRLVMAAFKGVSTLHIDHLNGIKTDNRLENLEYVTRRMNTVRGFARLNGLVGIKPCGKKWNAIIRHKKVSYNLGLFPTAIDAHNAYMAEFHKYTAIELAQHNATPQTKGNDGA